MVEIINLLTNKITTILTTNDIEFKQVLNSHLNSHPNINFRNVAFISNKHFLARYFEASQGPRAGRGFNELNQEVQHHQCGWGQSLDHSHCSEKTQNLKPHFWGGHTSKTFCSKPRADYAKKLLFLAPKP